MPPEAEDGAFVVAVVASVEAGVLVGRRVAVGCVVVGVGVAALLVIVTLITSTVGEDPAPAGTSGEAVATDDGEVGDVPARPFPTRIPTTTKASTINPPTAHAHAGTDRNAGQEAMGRPKGPSGARGRDLGRSPAAPIAVPPATPSAWAIASALSNRSDIGSASAFNTAASVRRPIPGITALGGTKLLGSAIRCVAVGGACPVRAW